MKIFGVVGRIKAPIGYKGVWINIYRVRHGSGVHVGGAYTKRVYADAVAKSSRKECVFVHIKI